MKTVISILAAILLLAGAAFAAETITVQSEGVAQKADDLSEVKRKAIDSGLKAAVQDALRQVLSREALSIPGTAEEAIANSASSYVLNYKIRSEGWVTHMEGGAQASVPGSTELYHVWIEASVDADALRAGLGKFAGSSGAPIAINIIGVRDYPSFRALVEALRKIALISDLSYSAFAAGRITLTASAGGSVSALAERIAREAPGDYSVSEWSGQIIIRPIGGVVQ